MEGTETERKPLLEGKEHATNSREITSDVDNAAAKNDVLETRVYKRRWYIVFLFTAVNIAIGYIWTRWSFIEKSAIKVYEWEDCIWMITLQLSWGCICAVLTMVPFLWILETKGLRYGLVMATLFMALGISARCITSSNPWATVLINISSFTSQLGGPVIFVAPPMLSAIWFPASERVLSTSLPVFGNLIGTGLPGLFGLMIVKEIPCLKQNLQNICTVAEINEQRDQIMKYNYIEAGIAGVLFLMVLIYFPAKPPNPPSLTANIQRVQFWPGLRQCLSNKNLWLISIAFALTLISLTWQGLMAVIYDKTLGVTEVTSGWIGFTSQTVGAFGAVVFGRIANMRIFHSHMKTILFILRVTSLCFMVLLILMTEKLLQIGDDGFKGLLYVTTIGSVSLSIATSALFFEISCEAGYPLPESVITGMMVTAFNVVSICFLLISFKKDKDFKWMNYVLAGTTLITLPLIWKFRAEYTRSNIDNNLDHDETSIQGSTSISMKSRTVFLSAKESTEIFISCS